MFLLKKLDALSGRVPAMQKDMRFSVLVWGVFRAARWLQKYIHGEIPQVFDASHVCNNKKCVRSHPNHVITEKHADNMKRSAEC